MIIFCLIHSWFFLVRIIYTIRWSWNTDQFKNRRQRFQREGLIIEGIANFEQSKKAAPPSIKSSKGLSDLNNYIRGAYDKFPDFFAWAFKITVDSWTFSMLLLYILWDDWPIFMISGSNQQLQQQLEYTLLKLDCHSWWISKMQSDTWEERYAIIVCFKHGMLQECFRLLFDHLEWIEHQFCRGIKDSRKTESVRDDESCGRSKEVNTPCWGFKGVRDRFRRKRPALLKSGQWHQSSIPS